MAKITYLGRDITGRYNRLNAFQRFYRRFVYHLKRTLRVGGILALIAWLMLGSLKFGIAYAQGTTMSYIAPIANAQSITPKDLYPVLSRIGDCESGNGKEGTAKQFDKNGQVVKHVNMKGDYAGTVDIGKYGINVDIWGKVAGKHGWNLYTEAGNRAMAEWLIDQQGTAPWDGTSGFCWKR
jgi:hypothetical protein